MSAKSGSCVPFTVLGINMFQKDSAACLVQDGRVVAAADEERFRRIKHYGGFPRRAIEWCLRRAGIALSDVHSIIGPLPVKAVFREMGLPPVALPEPPLAFHPLSDDEPRVLGSHHLWHAASAYYTSGFDHAAVLTADAMGNNDSAVYYLGRGRELIRQTAIDHRMVSLGGMYQNISEHLGFGEFGAGKVMGLAPYGTVMDEWRELLDIRSFDHAECRWRHDSRHPLKYILRLPGEPLTQRHMDLAATVQYALEQSIVNLMTEIHERSGETRFCLAGGVFLNCAMNGKLARLPFVEKLYLHPNAADGGTAVGAALEESVRYWEEPLPEIRTSAWGPSFAEEEIAAALEHFPRREALSIRRPDNVADEAASRIAAGGIVGYFNGPMEWGPRALGRRSLLADPRNATMWERVNRVKGREPWRPLAPSVLAEEAPSWFEDYRESLFMLMAFSVKPDKRDKVPAICHVDGTARPHAVFADENPEYHALLSAFHRRTGVPMVLNTSFNDRNEPIVCTPDEALHTAWKLRLSGLVLGSYWVDGFDHQHATDGRCRVFLTGTEAAKAVRVENYRRIRGVEITAESNRADFCVKRMEDYERNAAVPSEEERKAARHVLVGVPGEPEWFYRQRGKALRERLWLAPELLQDITEAMRRILGRGTLGPISAIRLIRHRLDTPAQSDSSHYVRTCRTLARFLTLDLALLARLGLWAPDDPLNADLADSDLRRQRLRTVGPRAGCHLEIRYGQTGDETVAYGLTVIGSKGALRFEDRMGYEQTLYLGLTEKGPFHRIWMRETPPLEKEGSFLLALRTSDGSHAPEMDTEFWMDIVRRRDDVLASVVAKEHERVAAALKQDGDLERRLIANVPKGPISRHLCSLGLVGPVHPAMEHLNDNAYFSALQSQPSFLWCTELPSLLLDLDLEPLAVFENRNPSQVSNLRHRYEARGFTVTSGLRYDIDRAHAERTEQGNLTTVYVARDADTARELAELERIVEQPSSRPEKQRAEVRTGALLGYPACCIAGFQAAHRCRVDALFKQHGLLHTQARPLALLNNIPPFRLLSHFPHAYDCEPSQAWVARRLRGLRKGLPAYLDTNGKHLDEAVCQAIPANLDRFLAMPTLYWDYFRYVLFDGTMTGNELCYQAVYGPLELVEPHSKNRFSDQRLYRAFHLDVVERLRRANRLVLDLSTIHLYRDDRCLESLGITPDSRMLLFHWERGLLG